MSQQHVESFIGLLTLKRVGSIGPGIALHAHLQTLLLLLRRPQGTGSIHAIGVDWLSDATFVPLGLQPLILTQLQIPLLQALLMQFHIQALSIQWRQRFD